MTRVISSLPYIYVKMQWYCSRLLCTQTHALMLDDRSRSDTLAVLDIRSADAAVGHAAKIGSIPAQTVFYLMSRGLREEEARATVVTGVVNPVSQELPLEYALEMNNLIHLEMQGAIG